MGSWLEEFSFPGLFGTELVFSSNVFLISKQGQILEVGWRSLVLQKSSGLLAWIDIALTWDECL